MEDLNKTEGRNENLNFRERREAFSYLERLTKGDKSIPEYQKCSVNWLLKIAKKEDCQFKHKEEIVKVSLYIKKRGWGG